MLLQTLTHHTQSHLHIVRADLVARRFDTKAVAREHLRDVVVMAVVRAYLIADSLTAPFRNQQTAQEIEPASSRFCALLVMWNEIMLVPSSACGSGGYKPVVVGVLPSPGPRVHAAPCR